MTALRTKSILVSLFILATIVVRASIPEGFMPAAPGTGLLYELCPSAVPGEVMQTLARWGGKGQHAHHTHHGHSDAAAPDHASHDSDQCQIGHLLASAVVVDTTPDVESLPSSPEFVHPPVFVYARTLRTATSSRGPPA